MSLWVSLGHEWRLISRERLPAAVLVVLALAAGYALANGHRFAAEQREREAAVREEEQARLANLQSTAAAIEAGTGSAPRFRDPSKAAWVGEFLANRYAIWPAPPLTTWAVGQRDLMPWYFRITTLSRETFVFENDIENPLALALGRFDLAFVIVFLLPLLVIATTYDMVAGEREAGTLDLIRASPVRLWSVVAIKGSIRGGWCLAAMILILLVDVAVHAAALESALLGSFVLWAIAVAAYVAFCVATSALVNALCRQRVTCGLWLLAIWLAAVVIVPAAVGAAAAARHPTPNRVAIHETVRELRRELAGRGGLLDAYYRANPAHRPATEDRTDWAPGFYALQLEIDKTVMPLHAEHDQRVMRQQAFVDRWRWISPALLTSGVLMHAAGTGMRHYLNFLQRANAYHQEWQAYFLPRIFSRTRISAAEYDGLPAFVLEPSAAIAGSGSAAVQLVLLWSTAGALAGVAALLMRRRA